MMVGSKYVGLYKSRHCLYERLQDLIIQVPLMILVDPSGRAV
jgi:hypothetical protein